MITNELLDLVIKSIKRLYTEDEKLITRGLCERCLVHRLAFYLQLFFPSFYVDCEFNKSYYKDRVDNKILSNINGNYVDIIIHKRTNNYGENLLCFEVKKSKNLKNRDKDRKNLRILTAPDRFAYIIGFYLILGESYKDTELELYSNSNFVKKVPLF